MEHELYNIEPKEFKVLDRVEIDNNLRYVFTKNTKSTR